MSQIAQITDLQEKVNRKSESFPKVMRARKVVWHPFSRYRISVRQQSA